MPDFRTSRLGIMSSIGLLLGALFAAGAPLFGFQAAPDTRVPDVWSAAVSSDGKFVVASAGRWDESGEVVVWGLAARKPLRRFIEDRGVPSVVFSPDGKLVAWGSWTGVVKICDWAAGKQIAALPVQSVARVAFAPAGKLLASATEANTVQLWDTATGELVADLGGEVYKFYCVAFSPDGSKVLAGGGIWKKGAPSLAAVWDVATRKQVMKLSGHDLPVLCLAFSPDGCTLATGSADSTIRLWDMATGLPRKTLVGHTALVECLEFTADGKTLMSGSHDRTIRFWDVERGEEKQRLSDVVPAGTVRAAHLTPDGATLIVGGGQKTLKLLDGATHNELAVLSGGAEHAVPLEAVTLTAEPKSARQGLAPGRRGSRPVADARGRGGKNLRPLKGVASAVVQHSPRADGSAGHLGQWRNAIPARSARTSRERKNYFSGTSGCAVRL